MMKKFFIFVFLSVLIFSGRGIADPPAGDPGNDPEKLSKELAAVKTDRDNILKQTKAILAEKDALQHKFLELQGSGGKVQTEIESLKKEAGILRSDLEKTQQQLRDREEAFLQEKRTLEGRIAELDTRNNSLAQLMSEYTPAKIEQLNADRNRLEQENRNMAARVLDYEKQIEEFRRQMKPFELDREELYKLRLENKEITQRLRYTTELEERQKQLLRENAEYREKVEILKAKFSDAAPGLAKSGRISQKMMRENADMHYNLGTIFLNNKQYKEAIQEYERVLELRPSDPETHYNLGILYDDYSKDSEKALYHYQKYLAVNPKAPDAKKVESYILNLELEQKVR